MGDCTVVRAASGTVTIEYALLPAAAGTYLLDMSIDRGVDGDEEDDEEGWPPIHTSEYAIIAWRVPLHKADADDGADLIAVMVGRCEDSVPIPVQPYEWDGEFHIMACVMPGDLVCSDGAQVPKEIFMEKAKAALLAARDYRLASFKKDFDVF